MKSSTYVRTNRKPTNQMSTNELRQVAVEDGYRHYKAVYEADPYNVEKRSDYLEYCRQNQLEPDEEVSRLYETSMDDLRNEWETKGRVIEETQLETYREKQAQIWMLSRPEYAATSQNAERLIAELERLGLRGNPYEFDQCFWNCVRRGEIAPKDIIEAVPLPNRDELYDMPLDQLKNLVEGSGR